MTEPAQPEKQNDKPGVPQSNKPESGAAKQKPTPHPYADFSKEEFGLGGFILAFGAARPPKKKERPVPKVPIRPPATVPTPAPPTYQEHYASRVATFDYYLRVMNQRREGERGPDCAIVFS